MIKQAKDRIRRAKDSVTKNINTIKQVPSRLKLKAARLLRKAKNASLKHVTTLREVASHLTSEVGRQLGRAEQPCKQARAVIVKVSHIVQRWAIVVWDKHCEQVHKNGAYAAAVAAVVTTVVELTVHNPAALTVVAAVVAVYLAVHQVNNADRYRPADPWADGGLNWR